MCGLSLHQCTKCHRYFDGDDDCTCGTPIDVIPYVKLDNILDSANDATIYEQASNLNRDRWTKCREMLYDWHAVAHELLGLIQDMQSKDSSRAIAALADRFVVLLKEQEGC